MAMYKKILIIITLVTLFFRLSAQEFRCAVSINYQKLQQTTQQYASDDKKVFETMKQTIEDFVNNRKWTTLTLEQTEKIDCSISIVLSERSTATDFKGQIQVQLRRPVYNSNYTTGLLNYIENSSDFQFSFNESQTLEFDPNSFYSNLTSTVAYYLYIMLGMQWDSFGLMGGEPFYQAALNISSAAETSGYKGWRSSEGSKARYWFVENHTNSAYSKLREAYYNYHRLGLDLMTKDQPQARQNIIKALQDVQSVHKVRTNVLSVQQFIDVKIQEIVSIFTPAPDDEKKQVYMIIKDVSPINVTKLKDWNIK